MTSARATLGAPASRRQAYWGIVIPSEARDLLSLRTLPTSRLPQTSRARLGVCAAIIFLATTAALAADPPPVATLTSPSPIRSLIFAHDGAQAVALCRDDKLRIWSLPAGKLEKTIDAPPRSVSLAVSVDGRYAAIFNWAGDTPVLDLTTGAVAWRAKFDHYIGFAAFTRDSRLVALAGTDESPRVFEVSTGRELYRLPQHPAGSQSVAFSRDGALLATADSDTAVRIYDARSGKQLAEYTGFALEPFAVDFTSDGRTVIAAGADAKITFINTSDGRAARQLSQSQPVAVLQVAPAGDRFVTAFMNPDNMSAPAPIVVWQTSSGEKLSEWQTPDAKRRGGGEAVGGGWTGDGHLLVALRTPEGAEVRTAF
jgi:WD40 repeat protein